MLDCPPPSSKEEVIESRGTPINATLKLGRKRVRGLRNMVVLASDSFRIVSALFCLVRAGKHSRFSMHPFSKAIPHPLMLAFQSPRSSQNRSTTQHDEAGGNQRSAVANCFREKETAYDERDWQPKIRISKRPFPRREKIRWTSPPTSTMTLTGAAHRECLQQEASPTATTHGEQCEQQMRTESNNIQAR